MSVQAIWFDGESAVEHSGTVEIRGANLHLGNETVPLSDLVRLYARHGQWRFGRKSVEGWRLVFDDHPPEELARDLPARIVNVAPAINRKAAAMGVVASVAIVAMIASLFLAPQLIAQRLPMPIERKIGDAIEIPGYIARCESPAADEALWRLVDKLDPDARDDGFTFEILAVNEVNAAALPGGRIVILNGLLDAAGNGEAIAGILAHEIAHVRRRHVAAAAVRNLGMSGIISIMGGGRMSQGAGGLLSLKFGREAESEADADAVAMLETAGINPRPTAEMFEYFAESEVTPSEWMSSHPASGGRAKAFADSHHEGRIYQPAMKGSDEDALFDACYYRYITRRVLVTG